MRVVIFSAFLFLALQIQATTLVYKSFDDLVEESEGIIMGTVTNVETRKHVVNKEEVIYTYVTLGRLNMLYGQYDKDVITLRLEGGLVGNEGLHVSGSPVFRQKDEVILFVAGNGSKIVPFVGWGQGVFHIRKDPESGQQIITDNDGNRVLNIKDGHINRERRTPSNARIIGSPPPLHPYSRPAEGGSGQKKGAEAVQSVKDTKDIRVKGVLTPEEFIKTIQERAKSRKAPRGRLNSVTIGSKPELPKGKDARRKDLKGKAGVIKQVPNTEARPGELPKRIDTDADKKEAKKKESKKKKDD